MVHYRFLIGRKCEEGILELLKNKGISSSDLGYVLAWATANKQRSIQDFFETNRTSVIARGYAARFAGEAWEQALIVAAEKGTESEIKELFREETISDKTLGCVLGWVIVRGFEEIKSDLESRGISKEARGWAVIVAAWKGCESGVRRLLGEGEISVEALGRALGQAVIENHEEVERYLESEEITEKALTVALHEVVEAGCRSGIQKLLTGRVIAQDKLDALIEQAAGLLFGNVLVLDALLSDGRTVSEETREMGIFDAVSSGNIEILDRLLRVAPVSQEVVDRMARVAAASRNNVLALEPFLFSRRTDKKIDGKIVIDRTIISRDVRARCILRAVSSQQVAILGRLLRVGPIPRSLKEFILKKEIECSRTKKAIESAVVVDEELEIPFSDRFDYLLP